MGNRYEAKRSKESRIEIKQTPGEHVFVLVFESDTVINA